MTQVSPQYDVFANFRSRKPAESLTKQNTAAQNPVSNHYDVYHHSPVRLLGFTNELGTAVSPLAGAFMEMISYVPALTYIFMDVKDKYNRGDKDNYNEKSHKRATKQFAFQFLASVLFPTAIVKTSQVVAGKAIDLMPKSIKNPIKNFIEDKLKLKGILKKLADHEEKALPPDAGFKDKFFDKLNAAGHRFQKVIDTITVVPKVLEHIKYKKIERQVIEKAKTQGRELKGKDLREATKEAIKGLPKNSGLRNLALAVVGIGTLLACIKPLDRFVEHVIIEKGLHPLLYGKEEPKKLAEPSKEEIPKPKPKTDTTA